MFPVQSSFIPYSLEALQKEPDAIGQAKTCVRLLKSSQINKLSCHEWVEWLGKTKDYLETALKIDKDAAKLLEAELRFRKKDHHLPVIASYGKVENGAITVAPQLRLISLSRTQWGLLKPEKWKKPSDWDGSEETEAVLQHKNDQICDEIFTNVGNPVTYAKRLFNAPKPIEFSTVKNKEDANALVRYLEDLQLIPWRTNLYDCHYLALAAWEFIEALNADPKAFRLLTVGSRFSFESNHPGPSLNGLKWQYHVGLAVETKEDGPFILDPWVDPVKALTIEEWKKILNASDLPTSSESIAGIDLSERAMRASTAFAIATGNRFPGLDAKIPSETHPLLKELIDKIVNPPAKS